MRSRRFVLAFVAALAVISGACGGGDSSTDLATKDPKAAMAAASKRTTAAKTVRIALTATSDNGVKVLEGSGSYDFPNERGRFNLKTTLGAGADLLITPSDVYVKVPAKANPTDPTWIKLTPQDIATGGSGQFVDSIRKQVDPRTTIDALGTNVPDLEKVGSQTLRGVKTTHLRGRVDLSDAAIAKAPASQREGLRAAQKTFGADGYPVDVWLDGDGRVRRVQYAVTSAGADGTETSTVVKLDLYDFGEAPAIELPDPSDVGDSASLATTTTVAK